ncbi:cyclophilin-like fold protein [Lachnospiraceae bacterium 46-61]
MKKKLVLFAAFALVFTVSACGSKEEKNITNNVAIENTNNTEAIEQIQVRFGDTGTSFTLHLYDNDTAKTIANFVGTEDLRLPIYHYDDYDNWEVMQYYDIPSIYEIPQNSETVTEQKAGEVYFEEGNRIVLFYKDAEISREYTKLGYFDASEDFVSAVENNPVLEGWGNKIVVISADKK